MDIEVIIEIMAVLFGAIIVGYILNKIKVMDTQSNSILSNLVVKVTTPAMVIASVCTDTPIEEKGTVWMLLIIGIGLYLFYIVIAWLLVKPFKVSEKDSSIYQMLLIFSNTGFMGYPIMRAIYGEQAVFYMSILHMTYNLLIYSYGIYLINRDNKDGAAFEMKKVVNSGAISAVLALCIYLLNIRVPKPAAELLDLIGGATIPLSMLVMGSSLALIPVKGMLEDRKLLLWSAIKMIAIPVVIFFVARLITDDQMIIGMLTLSGALPSGSLIVMLTTQYDGNTRMASLGVLITTLFSIVTIPLLAYLLL